MRKAALALLLILASCGGADWSLYKAPFFDLTIPPGFALADQNKNYLKFESDDGAISIGWSMDQHSMKDYPATEAVEGKPGDKVVVSEPQVLGKCKVWYSEIQGRPRYSVYLTLPLDRGELRIEAFTDSDPSDIRKAVRSVTVTNETFFSYPR
jgi:hypothetical protein